jgi:tetratricopeptide (TPR) repeat protein
MMTSAIRKRLIWSPESLVGQLVMFSCLALVGCAGSRQNTAPENLPMQQAIDFNHRAEAAFIKGDYGRALPLYLAALQRDAATENADGIALNQINVARTYAAMGKPQEAQSALDNLLVDATLQYAAERLVDATLLKAHLYAESGDATSAAHWEGKADVYCQNRCRQLGSLMLLRAQIALRSQQDEQALVDVNSALTHFKENAQPIEEANAQRLLGEIWLAKDQAAHAIECFEKALGLDREIGASRKIDHDLLLLGQAMQHANRNEEARAYYRRAAAVAKASADDQAAAEAADRLRDLDASTTDHPAAAQP